jgi:hypothetical protein
MLRNIPFILFESGFVLNKHIADGCKRQGFAPKIAARSSQVDFIVELVAAKRRGHNPAGDDRRTVFTPWSTL